MASILITIALGAGFGYTLERAYSDLRNDGHPMAVWSAAVCLVILSGLIANVVSA